MSTATLQQQQRLAVAASMESEKLDPIHFSPAIERVGAAAGLWKDTYNLKLTERILGIVVLILVAYFLFLHLSYKDLRHAPLKLKEHFARLHEFYSMASVRKLFGIILIALFGLIAAVRAMQADIRANQQTMWYYLSRSQRQTLAANSVWIEASNTVQMYQLLGLFALADFVL